MDKKVGRNDPCPCGSGKKYKNCCMQKDKGPKKFSAKVISSGPKNTLPNLMERTFGDAIKKAEEEGAPPKPDDTKEPKK